MNRSLILSDIASLLIASRSRITTAESCTGGGIAAALTGVSGASAWFDAGFVTYSNRSKVELLGVPETVIGQCGAVSSEVVEAMLRGALATSKASVGVAISGIAGPDGGTVDKPVGTVYIAWGSCKYVSSECFLFSGDRDQVRCSAVDKSLSMVHTWLRSHAS